MLLPSYFPLDNNVWSLTNLPSTIIHSMKYLSPTLVLPLVLLKHILKIMHIKTCKYLWASNAKYFFEHVFLNIRFLQSINVCRVIWTNFSLELGYFQIYLLKFQAYYQSCQYFVFINVLCLSDWTWDETL